MELKIRPRILGWIISIAFSTTLALLFLGARQQHLSSVDAATLLTIIAIFIGSLAAGLAGFAFSAIAGALLLHWLAPAVAVPLLLACSITSQVVSIANLWRSMQWRRSVPFLVGGLAGIPLGALLLRNLDPHSFAAGFGAFLVCYSGYMLFKPNLAFRNDSRWIETIVGLGGGVLGGAIAFPGALPTIWYNLRGLPKDTQRGTIQPFILLMQIATLVYFSRFGMITQGLSSLYLLCAPAVVAGTWLGLRLFHHIDDAAFRRVILLLLLVSGGTLVL
jgi:uncharacterized membrane protein YfcA